MVPSFPDISPPHAWRLFSAPFLALALVLAAATPAFPQDNGRIIFTDPKGRADSALAEDDLIERPHASGIDVMVGTDGFGLGFFYNRLFADVWTVTANLSLSQVRDSRLREYYDYYGNSYAYNRVNRILRIPLMLGLQYRLFKDDIVDNFRPFINGGAGPVMLYVHPARNSDNSDMEYFTSLGKGYTKFTYGGYVGAGAQFGFDRSSLVGLNVRYYIIPVPAGIPSVDQGNLPDANGFYITLNAGFAF